MSFRHLKHQEKSFTLDRTRFVMEKLHCVYLCKLSMYCSITPNSAHFRTMDSNDYNELPLQLRAHRTNSETTDYNFSTIQDWLPHMRAPLTYDDSLTTTTTYMLPPNSTGDFTEATSSETTTVLDQDQMNDDIMEHNEHKLVSAEPHFQYQETEFVSDDGEELS